MNIPTPPVVPGGWLLKDGVTFLNHGSFGSLPRAMAEFQDDLRRRIEAEPIEMIGRRNGEYIERAKVAVGNLLNMSPADFGLVTNATEGVNVVLRSLRLKPTDEILTTNHVYNAVRKTISHVVGLYGSQYREVEVRTPVASGRAIVDTMVGALRSNTRLVVIDHVTSPTALRFPVEEIVAECAKRKVDVLVDGAHAPGMIELDVPAIGAAYYAGNLHKWCCGPKGCAFIWVSKEKRENIHPATISHEYDAGFPKEFEWQGTRDLSAWWALPRVLEFMGNIGWDAIRAHNHAMAVWANGWLSERLGVEMLSPADGSLLGSMATLPLPGRLARMTMAERTAFAQSVYCDERLEIPIFEWQGVNCFRVACQVYNRVGDFERLVEVVRGRQ